MRIPVSAILAALILAEIAGFILVGEAIGVLPTLGLVLLGMLAGALLLRQLGIATLVKAQAEMAAGRTPARPLAEGAIKALAAALIILPGFVSDFLGILLFIPLVRETLWRAVRRRVSVSSATFGGASTSREPVIDLDRSEYGSARAKARPNTPWRLPDDSET
jgi:UPF0716 protein FxsA